MRSTHCSPACTSCVGALDDLMLVLGLIAARGPDCGGGRNHDSVAILAAIFTAALHNPPKRSAKAGLLQDRRGTGSLPRKSTLR